MRDHAPLICSCSRPRLHFSRGGRRSSQHDCLELKMQTQQAVGLAVALASHLLRVKLSRFRCEEHDEPRSSLVICQYCMRSIISTSGGGVPCTLRLNLQAMSLFCVAADDLAAVVAENASNLNLQLINSYCMGKLQAHKTTVPAELCVFSIPPARICSARIPALSQAH